MRISGVLTCILSVFFAAQSRCAFALPKWAEPPLVHITGSARLEWDDPAKGNSREYVFEAYYTKQGYVYKLVSPQEELVVAESYGEGVYKYWHSGDHTLYRTYLPDKTEYAVSLFNPLSHLILLRKGAANSTKVVDPFSVSSTGDVTEKASICYGSRPEITICYEYQITNGDLSSMSASYVYNVEGEVSTQEVSTGEFFPPYHGGVPSRIVQRSLLPDQRYEFVAEVNSVVVNSLSFSQAVLNLSSGMKSQPYGQVGVDDSTRNSGLIGYRNNSALPTQQRRELENSKEGINLGLSRWPAIIAMGGGLLLIGAALLFFRRRSE